ncbi:hypothetical protein D9615_001358 [Tricholomella constricta]|uniref:DNA replication regulator SLD2 n=1 Tax=Tricholomella constricta TaxID=117010 RepID=A0A8H5M8K6_9AGAR|nr:hypothetical protein D9615_001358 [Tricholomella constricta]
MDVSTVKADIKAWERSFRATNARDPTIQDIKLQPEIAEKYRLYKKLTKVTNKPVLLTSAHTSSDPPSTPPRSRSRSHQPPSLIIQPRAIGTTAPLSSFNPFSPQKNKGKEKESVTRSHFKSSTSPFKSKGPPVDPLPILDFRKPSTSSVTPPRSPPAATSALSRARKRLRGEPVSPSPNKGKRRRIGSQTTLPFTKLVAGFSSSEDEGDHDTHSSFISDSPVKAPAGGKSFKLLFDESKSVGSMNGKAPIARTKSTTARGLFGGKSLGGLDEDADWDLNSVDTRVKKSKHKAAPFKSSAAPAATGSAHISITDQTEKRMVAKRALSDIEETHALDIPQSPSAGPSLLPPSPPPADSSAHQSKQYTNARGKGRVVLTGRKKAKTTTHQDEFHDESEEDEDDSDTLKANVRIVDRRQNRPHSTASTTGRGEYDLDLDPDPILGYSRRVAPRGHETSLPSDVELEGKFDVDLPDKLRHVLALESTESKARNLREERVVQGLVFGRRTTRYDPDKGGEIWDVGEDDMRQAREEETRRDTEGEDDWEGEPVPWEVGEL